MVDDPSPRDGDDDETLVPEEDEKGQQEVHVQAESVLLEDLLHREVFEDSEDDAVSLPTACPSVSVSLPAATNASPPPSAPVFKDSEDDVVSPPAACPSVSVLLPAATDASPLSSAPVAAPINVTPVNMVELAAAVQQVSISSTKFRIVFVPHIPVCQTMPFFSVNTFQDNPLIDYGLAEFMVTYAASLPPLSDALDAMSAHRQLRIGSTRHVFLDRDIERLQGATAWLNDTCIDGVAALLQLHISENALLAPYASRCTVFPTFI